MSYSNNDYSRQSSNKAILEDYMLEDDGPRSHPQRLEHLNYNKQSDQGQWPSGESTSTAKVPSTVQPPTNVLPPGWQQASQAHLNQFPSFNQPPPTYAQQSNYYQYDYSASQTQSQQQYNAYSGYYQGYGQDYSQHQPQTWVANQQPPPPGLVFPDLSQPPPVPQQASVTSASQVANTVSAPVPAPVPAPSSSHHVTESSKHQIRLSPEIRPKSRTSKKKKEKEKSREKRKEEKRKKESSKENDNERLFKQRDEYLAKSAKLSKNLRLLREQKTALLGESYPDSKLIRENNKLQDEIQSKLKGIDNVVSMLDGILRPYEESHSKRRKRSRSESSSRSRSSSKSKDRSHRSDKERKSKRTSSSSSSSSDDEEEKVMHDEEEEDEQDVERKVKPLKDEKEQDRKKAEPESDQVNFTFFDPEEHWCHYCGVFPATAKEFLNHLHTSDHKQNFQKKKSGDIPWHQNNVEKDRPFIKGAPTTRVPIKGLQFFVPVSGWYCKLCSAWIGDLHCASLHLKSQKHIDNYESFVEENKGWEETWYDQRKDAFKREEELKRHDEAKKQIEEISELHTRPASHNETKSRDSWPDSSPVPLVRESLKITVANDEAREYVDTSRSVSLRAQKLSQAPEQPMGPALPPQQFIKQSWNRVESLPATPVNGSSKGQWVVKMNPKVEPNLQRPESEVEHSSRDAFLKKKESEESPKIEKSEYYIKKQNRDEPKKEEKRGDFKPESRDEYYNKRDDREESLYRKDDKKEKKRDRKARDRSRDKSRTRSRSRGRDSYRDSEFSRSRSRERRGRRRRSSSARNERSRSASNSPTLERKPKMQPKKWIAPPSSPPPYINRKNDDKDKFDKPKKKPSTPNPVASLPKSKLPFIGRMPLFKKKKQTVNTIASEPPSDVNNDRRAPEDMDIDSGASDSEQQSENQMPEYEEVSLPAIAYTHEQVAEPIVEEPQVIQPPPADAIPLPQDFQDALSILFPDQLAAQAAAEATIKQVSEPVEEIVTEVVAPSLPTKKRNCDISEEELMMLGIDPEDMVAQVL